MPHPGEEAATCGDQAPVHMGPCAVAVQGADPCLAILGLDLTGFPSWA